MSARRLGAFLLAGAIGVAAAGPSREEPCSNFGQFSPGLYRGAAPDERCLDHLAGMGIRMVVNLRDEKDASDRERTRAVAVERPQGAPSAGLHEGPQAPANGHLGF
jgi:hypothetical protein